MKFFKYTLLVSFITLSVLFIVLTPPVYADDTKPTATVEVAPFNAKAGSYELINPIGNISSIKDQDPGGLSNFFNLLIKIAIAMAGALAVIVIIINGIQYMGTDSVWEKGETKFKIGAAIGGIILLLTSYIILFTINPDLVNIRIGITKGTEGTWELDIAATEYRASQNPSTFEKTGQYEKIKSFVNSHNYPGYGKTIPHCIAQVTVLRETNGNPNLIGHDENAPLSDVRSRISFINSGKTFKGTIFTAGNKSLITTGSHLNDDNKTGDIYSALDLNKDDLSLDWRFSHGIGLMQVTFYPKGESYNPYDKGGETLITKTKITPKSMLNIDTALAAGVEHLQYDYNLCKGDVLNTFRAYGSGGGCNDARAEATLRKKLYDECITQDK